MRRRTLRAGGSALPGRAARGGARKRDEPHEHRRDLPLCGSARHGRGAAHEGGSDPLYRRAVRVSMGTVFQVPWTYLPGGLAGYSAHARLPHRGARAAGRQSGSPIRVSEGSKGSRSSRHGGRRARRRYHRRLRLYRAHPHAARRRHAERRRGECRGVSISWENPRNNAVDTHKQPWYPEITNRTKGGGTHGKEA